MIEKALNFNYSRFTCLETLHAPFLDEQELLSLPCSLTDLYFTTRDDCAHIYQIQLYGKDLLSSNAWI